MTPYFLVLLGLFLVMLEFFLPGAVMGTAGAILIIVSFVVFAMNYGVGLELFGFITFTVIFLSIIIRVTLKRIQGNAAEQTIYLDADEEGFTASKFDEGTIGKEGVAATDLKPSGHIIVDHTQHQAVSQAGYITKGASIVVLRGKGAYLVVKEKEPTS